MNETSTVNELLTRSPEHRKTAHAIRRAQRQRAQHDDAYARWLHAITTARPSQGICRCQTRGKYCPICEMPIPPEYNEPEDWEIAHWLKKNERKTSEAANN